MSHWLSATIANNLIFLREICLCRAYSACERSKRSHENLFFPGCGKLKAIRVPANAKSWAGMKEWLGIPLVFDAE